MQQVLLHFITKLLVLLPFCLALPVQGQTATWKGNTGSTAWTDPANWAEGIAPTASSSVVINSCTVCPVLSSDVTLNGFSMNTGSSIDLQSFTVTSTAAYLYFATITSTTGKIAANDIWNVTSCVFNAPGGSTGASVTLEKKGPNMNMWSGGNTFNVRATIAMNNPVGGYTYLRTATHAPDVFNEEAIINRLAGTGMAIGFDCCGSKTFGPVQFKKKLTFNSYGDGGILQVVHCEGEVVLNAYPPGRINVNGYYAGPIALNIHNVSGSSIIYLEKCTINGAVTVNNYNRYHGGSVLFGRWASTCTFSPSASLQVGPGGFSRGVVYFENTSMQTSALTNFDLNRGLLASEQFGKVYLYNGSTFSGPLQVTAANIFLNGAVFNQNATFTKTGAGVDNSVGNNIFRKKLTITNQAGATSPMNLATQSPDLIQQQ